MLVATSLVRELVLIGNFTYGGVGNLNLDLFLATGVDVVKDRMQVLDRLLQRYYLRRGVGSGTGW